VALRSYGVVQRTNFPSTEKTVIQKEEQENTVKTNDKRRKDLRMATWNVRSLYRTRGLCIKELRKKNIAIAAIKETSWTKPNLQAFASNGFNIYTSSLKNKHEFGTAFVADSKVNHLVTNFTPINERL
jgi:hypothetical protein